MAEFHETKMGRQFYDKTMPALVKAIEKLNSTLERCYSNASTKDDEDNLDESS